MSLDHDSEEEFDGLGRVSKSSEVETTVVYRKVWDCEEVIERVLSRLFILDSKQGNLWEQGILAGHFAYTNQKLSKA